MLLTHADVVPVGDNERDSWSHEPFGGQVDDGYVWGRGAIDNKASTICILKAIASLQKAGLPPRRDIQVLLLPDEEIGGQAGIPSYRFQPFTLSAEERGRIHGIDERLSLDNLRQAVGVYAHLIRYL